MLMLDQQKKVYLLLYMYTYVFKNDFPCVVRYRIKTKTKLKLKLDFIHTNQDNNIVHNRNIVKLV